MGEVDINVGGCRCWICFMQGKVLRQLYHALSSNSSVISGFTSNLAFLFEEALLGWFEI